ncbi:MAG: hypothetical protein FJ320_05965 [SAR202 cluster bacterium]|nr:hypothetical protein [SAR202 cluster bacterium]
MALTKTVAGRTYSYSHCVGGLQMCNGPMDIALAEKGVVYVVSRSTGADTYFGTFFQRWTQWDLENDSKIGETGAIGSGDGQFIWPAGIARDSSGNVYVTDEYLNRVSVFTRDRAFVTKWGEAGSAPGQLGGAAGIRLDDDDNVYISESRNHRIQKFSKDGQHLAVWGGKGSGPGDLDSPFGIHLDRQGNVYVADWGNDRVQKFSPDGAFLLQFGASGPGPGQLRSPTGVAVDSDGDVYVADWGNNRVQIFNPDAEFITSLHGDARELSKFGARYISASPDMLKARRHADTSVEWPFRRPIAIAIDPDDNILVMDSLCSRIQIYRKERGYTEPQFNL